MTIVTENKDRPFVVMIGAANMDICGVPSATLIHKGSNPGTVSLSPGGVARNIAENLARLGIDSRLIAAIGTDYFGKTLLRQGQHAGIDMSHIIELEDQQTSSYLSVLDDGGDLLVAINDMTIADQLTCEHIKKHHQILIEASVIIVDTNISEEIFAYLADRYADQPIMVDTVSATKAVRIKPYLSSVHTLKANRMEAQALCGINISLTEMAKWFHQQGVKRVFITLGPEGVFYSDENENGTLTVPKQANAILNANGAGDAFMAGITYAWLQNWGLIKSTKFAMSAAHVTLAHIATINPEMSLKTVNKTLETDYVN